MQSSHTADYAPRVIDAAVSALTAARDAHVRLPCTAAFVVRIASRAGITCDGGAEQNWPAAHRAPSEWVSDHRHEALYTALLQARRPVAAVRDFSAAFASACHKALDARTATAVVHTLLNAATLACAPNKGFVNRDHVGALASSIQDCVTLSVLTGASLPPCTGTLMQTLVRTIVTTSPTKRSQEGGEQSSVAATLRAALVLQHASQIDTSGGSRFEWKIDDAAAAISSLQRRLLVEPFTHALHVADVPAACAFVSSQHRRPSRMEQDVGAVLAQLRAVRGVAPYLREAMTDAGVIADFVWPHERLVLEVDGPHHFQAPSVHDVLRHVYPEHIKQLGATCARSGTSAESDAVSAALLSSEALLLPLRRANQISGEYLLTTRVPRVDAQPCGVRVDEERSWRTDARDHLLTAARWKVCIVHSDTLTSLVRLHSDRGSAQRALQAHILQVLTPHGVVVH
ncbi:MAG: hypothetical protein EOO65_00110 [Methanosarcinales archaeon]|nr:MAG: hypothetical protein EOO65_00110 [Methanosarcinales archaeon]